MQPHLNPASLAASVDNPVIIWGVPRSGTTWALDLLSASRQVLPRHQPIHSHTFAPRIQANSSIQEIRDFLAQLSVSNDPYLQTGLTGTVLGGLLSSDRVANGTMLIKEVRFLRACIQLISSIPAARLVFIVRNPVDVITSWMNAPREFEEGWSIDEEWRDASRKNFPRHESYFGFNAWKSSIEAISSAQKRFPGRIFAVMYEHLRADPINEFNRILRLLSIYDEGVVAKRLKELSSMPYQGPYSIGFSNSSERNYRSLPSHIRDEIVHELDGYELFIARQGLSLHSGQH